MEATIIKQRSTRERLDPVALSCLEVMVCAVRDARRELIATVDRCHDALAARAEDLEKKLRPEVDP